MVLYIHIPFCTSKCGYCAFSSYTGVDSSVQQAYIQCLLRDLSYTLSAYRAKKLESILINPALESSLAELDSSDFAPMELDSIYIGGGTPSLLPSSAYALISQQIARFCDMQSIQEITIEANPNTLQAQWCRYFSRLGLAH